MPRIEHEMPYGSGVVLGEEYVIPRSSLSNLGTTLFINLLANTMFSHGLEMDLYFAMGRPGGTIRQMTVCVRIDHPAECKCNNSTVRNIYIYTLSSQTFNPSTSLAETVSIPSVGYQKLLNKNEVTAKDIQHLCSLTENR